MKARLAAAFISACLPAIGAAQRFPVEIPKALVFPNYDNVLLGKDQALEGGAYIARTGDASANFYNPAGLVQSEKTSLNASSTGWVLTRVTSEELNTSVTSSKIDAVPGFFGAVIAPPWVGMRNLRIGLSLTRQVAWAPGEIDESATPSAADEVHRITYSSQASFITTLYQAAVAWAPISDRSLRLGASLGLANTTFDTEDTLSGLVAVGGNPGQFTSSLRASGNQWDMVFGLGVQWDVVAGLTLGAVVRSPGIRVTSGSLVTYEATELVPGQAPTSAFFRDETGRFEYRLPLEASFGIAYRFGGAQVEGDLRFHDATGGYDFFRPSVPVRVTTQNPDGSTSASTQPAPTLRYAARRVFNASVGGNVRVAETVTVHGGFYTALSPVADAATSPLRKADLFGFTGGVDFQFDHFGASLGAGYQFGTSSATPLDLGDQPIRGGEVKVQSISLLYAISYSF
jgi:hypothetical protein